MGEASLSLKPRLRKGLGPHTHPGLRSLIVSLHPLLERFAEHENAIRYPLEFTVILSFQQVHKVRRCILLWNASLVRVVRVLFVQELLGHEVATHFVHSVNHCCCFCIRR
jgi:hypothetical protein